MNENYLLDILLIKLHAIKLNINFSFTLQYFKNDISLINTEVDLLKS